MNLYHLSAICTCIVRYSCLIMMTIIASQISVLKLTDYKLVTCILHESLYYCYLRNECLFSRFMGNVSQCGTNKSREPRSGSRAICLFRTAIHFPWTEKKDTHSLYLQCLQQRSLLRFSEQSKKFKFPSEIGNMTLFPDIVQNSAWINREKGALSCMFLIHINNNNINSILKLN